MNHEGAKSNRQHESHLSQDLMRFDFDPCHEKSVDSAKMYP